MARLLPTPLLVVALLLGGGFSVFGQISITTGLTPQQYVDAFAGSGVSIIPGSITFSGNADQIGLFSVDTTGGINDPDIGITSGLVISSGDVNGLNNATNNTFISNVETGVGDADLALVAPSLPEEDAAYLEFQFTTDGDSVFFEYIFGSEEYPEFAPPVSNTFNDVFGFFISGPGIAGPINGKQNIAILPGVIPTVPVSINNVNAVTNCTFYRSNDNGTTTTGCVTPPLVTAPNFGYDGYTVVLTAQASINPCDTFTLKLAVADRGDQSFDTGVFLRAGSFGSNTLESVGDSTDASGNILAVEGCTNAAFAVTRPSGSVGLDTVRARLTGNATLGVDYPFPIGPTLSPLGTDSIQIIFPAGVDTIFVPIDPFYDNINELDTEVVVIQLPKTAICDSTDTLLFDTLRIKDVLPIETNIQGIYPVCFGDPFSLSPTITKGISPGASIVWLESATGDTLSTGPTLSIPFISTSQSVQVIITDECSFVPAFDTTFLIQVGSLTNPLIANERPDTAVCIGDSLPLYATATGGTGSYQFVWFDNTGAVIDTGQVVFVTPDTTQTYTLEVFDSCEFRYRDVKVFVDTFPSVAFTLPDTACPTAPALINFTGADTAALLYQWSFGTGIPATAAGIGPHAVVFSVPGIQTVTLTAQSQACTADSSQNILVLEYPVIDAGTDFTSCLTTVTGGVNASVNQDPAICTFEWASTSGTTVFADSFSLDYGTATVFALRDTLILNASCFGCAAEPDSVVVTLNPTPNILVTTPVLDLCQGGLPVQPGVTYSGGSGPLTPTWSPSTGVSDVNAFLPSFNPTATTVYTVTVTDTAGCVSAAEQVTVQVNPNPVVDLGPDIQACENSVVGITATVTPPGNYTLNWSTGTSGLNVFTENVTVLSTQIVSATATDPATGCSSPVGEPAASVVVQGIPEPTANLQPTGTVNLCPGEALNVGDQVLGTSSAYDFTWGGTGVGELADPTQGFTVFQTNTPGTYTLNLTATQGVCTGATTPDLTIVVAPAPVVTLSDTAICSGGSVQLVPTVTGTGPFTYSWLPATGLSSATVANPTAAPSATQTYTLTVTGQGFTCSGSGGVTVQVLEAPQPFAAHTAPAANFCLGNLPPGVELQPQANPADFTTVAWQDGTPFGPRTVNPTTSSQYVVEGSYGPNCTVRDTVWVNVLPGLTALPVFVTNDTLCAANGPVQIDATTGTGSASYQWTPAAYLDCPTCGVVNVVNPPAGQPTFNLTVEISEAGCSDIATIPVTVYPAPQAQFNVLDPEGCAPHTVTLNNLSQQATNVEWYVDGSLVSTAPGFQPAPFDSVGTHSITLVTWSDPDAQCRDSLSVSNIEVYDTARVDFLTNPLPTDTLYLPVATVQFTDMTPGATGWFWDFGDGQSSSQANPSHTYQAPGAYTVVLSATTLGGCSGTFEAGPFTVLAPTQFSPPTVFTPNGDGFNEQFLIQYTGGEAFEIQIYDRWGHQVFTSNSPTTGWDGTINGGSEAPTGVYIYRYRIGKAEYRGEVTLLR